MSHEGPVHCPLIQSARSRTVGLWNDEVEGKMEAVQKHRTGEKSLGMQAAENVAGTNAHWMPVRGDMMVGARGTSFPEGMLILVSNIIEPRDGQYVVARKGADTTFRQLREDAGKRFLRTLNPAYPNVELSEGWEFVGTVVSARYPESIFM